MDLNKQSRRTFLQTTTLAAAATAGPLVIPARWLRAGQSPNDRPVMGCIGTGDRWNGVGPAAMQFADCAAVCDVDAGHLNRAAEAVAERQGREPQVYEDYRQMLDREDLDVVVIVTPDHWHTKHVVDSLRAGCDVYCEKPLTLTIQEGKQILKVMDETGRVMQVGTQQRSEMDLRFLQAVALVQDGRIGQVRRVTCAIGEGPTSPSLPVAPVPDGLNWDMWLGQAPRVEYRQLDRHSRAHFEFRWWYEYSGGKMTDWGAHHVDIALWAIGMNGPGQGPQVIEPVHAEHPVPMQDGYPTDDSQYNTATKFNVSCEFANGIQMFIRDTADDLGFDNGIMFEGTGGRFLVNRGRIVGRPVEELEQRPLPEDMLTRMFNGRQPGRGNAHMRDFFESVQDRQQPISDAWTHVRAMDVCHLANIAVRLNRTIRWDPRAEQIVGDDEARNWQHREQRQGYEIDVEV